MVGVHGGSKMSLQNMCKSHKTQGTLRHNPIENILPKVLITVCLWHV